MSQTELAARLVALMEDHVAEGSCTVRDLLDDLACAGLQLTPNTDSNPASEEYIASLCPISG